MTNETALPANAGSNDGLGHGSLPWRCFHCDEVFDGRKAAELHFGPTEYRTPACQIRIEQVRWLEEQHQRTLEDDTEALRTIRGLVSEHETLRRRAEEAGYARGLADALAMEHHE